MVHVDKRAVAAGALLLWAGVLIADVRNLKQSEAFKNSELASGDSSMRLFGMRVDSRPEEADKA